MLFIFLALGIGASVVAADFGLVLGTAGEYAPYTGGDGFGFTGSSLPWFSMALGENTNLYLSGKLSFEYGYGTDTWAWPPLFELERTELNFRPVQTMYLVLGRQWFKDSGGMIASGLFDGLYGSFGLGLARLSLGAFYTGLIYKKTAEILMTRGDLEYYYKALDYGDPASYFASRRIIASVAGEFPDLSSRTSLMLNALAQFDLNDYGGDPPLHSQYLEARFDFEAADSLRFFTTGVGCVTESEGQPAKFNFAAAFGADWEIFGRLPDMVSAELRWGSGAVNDSIGPFKPVSGIAQGSVFAPTLPGLMNARVSYTARPWREFSFSTVAALFWRTDIETFTDIELDGASKDRFLGWELYGQLIWAPQSALRFSAGGGAFFPGGAFVENAETRWKINTGLTLSL
ncbi:MAG: hypothetical protein LBI91_01360 [Spirochaetaceae bacterium]|nr:hypothetical protein [Spirochaetaceae bacterium]